MRVTVALCTWNRSRLLDRALALLEALVIPEGVSWELVVVDNRSTDDTSAVLDRWAPRLPLRRAFEPRQGLSHARNRALDTATGELVLWTDDDVRVDPGWLAAYARATRSDSDAAFFGGPVRPSFPTPPPAWVAANLDAFAGALALRGDPPGGNQIKDPGHLPFGANFALRISACGGRRFDPDLGYRGGEFVGGEELRFLEGLLDAGHHGVWVRDAPVYHEIPPERATERCFWSYYHGKGRTRARTGRAGGGRLDLLRRYWKARWRMVRFARHRDARWARAFKGAATARGTLDELATLRRATRDS